MERESTRVGKPLTSLETLPPHAQRCHGFFVPLSLRGILHEFLWMRRRPQVPWTINVSALAFLSSAVKDEDYLEQTCPRDSIAVESEGKAKSSSRQKRSPILSEPADPSCCDRHLLQEAPSIRRTSKNFSPCGFACCTQLAHYRAYRGAGRCGTGERCWKLARGVHVLRPRWTLTPQWRQKTMDELEKIFPEWTSPEAVSVCNRKSEGLQSTLSGRVSKKDV